MCHRSCCVSPLGSLRFLPGMQVSNIQGRSSVSSRDQISEGALVQGLRSLVTAQPSKLLIYGPGGRSDFQKATENQPGVFASLIVQLPSTSTGGAFCARFQDLEQQYPLSLHPEDLQSVAHYTDVEYSLSQIYDGYRIAVVYSLCLPPVCTSPSLLGCACVGVPTLTQDEPGLLFTFDRS